MRDYSIYKQPSKTRLYFTYLKEKTELLLYVRPQGTNGSEMVYRRAPGDTALNERIRSMCDQSKVAPQEAEIWILLYPPEVNTTTIYVPSHARKRDLSSLIHEHIFSSMTYSNSYDWDNYHLVVHDNGHGDNMVTVTFIGSHVFPRLKEILGQSFSKVAFIGDGLQFLNIRELYPKHLAGRAYEMILPYDEVYYVAAFRSGLHVESTVLTHACSSSFGDYTLNKQQVYLDIRHRRNIAPQPMIQPVVPKGDWAQAQLTPTAFPNWFIARNSMHQHQITNLVSPEKAGKRRKIGDKGARRRTSIHLLD